MTMMRRAPRVLARSAVLAVVAGFVPLVATPSYGNAIPSGYRLIADAGSAASEGTIFTSHDDVTGSREIVRRDQDGSTSVVEPNGYDPEVSPDGQWLVFKRGTDSNTDHGDALYTQQLAVGPTSDTLLVSNSDYIVSYDISPDSTKVLYDQTCDLYITNIDSTGSPTDLGQLGAGCYADSPAYDPADPTKLAYDVSSDSGHGIFIYNTMTSTSTLLAGTGAGDFDPEWSADGSKIAYSHLGAQIGSTESYPFDEYVSNADGSGSATKVTTVAGVKQFDASFHWAKDGQSLLGAASFGGRPGLWRLPVDTDAGVEPELVDDGATGGTPQWASAMIPGSYVASSFPLTLAGGTPAQAFHVSAANEQTSHNSLDEIGITISNTTDLTAAQVHLTYDSGDGPQAVSLSDGAGGTITGTIELPGGIPAEAVRTTPMTVSLDAGASAQSLHVELMRLGDSDPENPVSEQGSEIVAATPTTTALDAPATAHSGAPVMLTATVDPSAATGTVTFYDGATPIGAPVTVTGGTAATTTSTLTNGQHTIEAVYSGAVATDTDPAYASSTSPTRSITIAGLPGAPGVTAQRGNDSAVITVTAPASDGGAAIDQYTITLTPGPITRTLTAPGTTTVSGLTNGVTYAVSATAHNSVGDGPAGTTSVTPAAVPDAPVASSVTAGNGRITLAFSTPASNGSPITGYTVTATPLDAASGSARKVTGTGSPVTVTGLTNGAAYSLVVHATNAIGDGPDSAPIVGVAGIAQGVSLLLSHNPVPVGHPLQFYGYVVDHSVPLPHTAVVLQQRLSKTKTNSLATVTTDAQGRFTYSLRLVHTGAVRAHAQIEGKTSYSKELLAKIAFVLLKVKAVISHGHVVITGFITPGSPSPFGEAPDRVAIYRSNAKGVKLAYIGDAKLTKTAKGAAKTGFTYDHKASVLAGSTYVYVNPLGTRANWSTHTTVRVT